MVDQANKGLLNSSSFVSKDTLIKLVDTYMDRKFAEDITYVEDQGGIDNYQNLLNVQFSTGLSSDKDQNDRISCYGNNKKEEKILASF